MIAYFFARKNGGSAEVYAFMLEAHRCIARSAEEVTQHIKREWPSSDVYLNYYGQACSVERAK